MLPAERYQLIVNTINQRGSVKVEELSEKLGISPSTIRRDLHRLNQAGKIIKTHGGAVSFSSGLSTEPPFEFRKGRFTEEKQGIALKAVDYIQSGDTIILDSGTTVYWMAHHLHNFYNLNIWTNDLHIAWELMNYDNVEITLLGGKIRKEYFNTMGILTNQGLDKIHVDLLFIGVDAINTKGGLMVYSPDEAELKRLMIESAQEVILVCDHTKFGKMALMSICPIESVHRIITSKDADKKTIAEIKKLKIPVDLV